MSHAREQSRDQAHEALLVGQQADALSEVATDGTPADVVMPAQPTAAHPAQPAGATHQWSFQPTRIPALDALLMLIDRVTHGKAGALQHVVSYLIAGGLTTIVSLATFELLYVFAHLPVPDTARYLIAYMGSWEISAIVNFALNDSMTFNRPGDHARTWIVRCLRFHSTLLGGLVVTLIFSLALHYGLGLNALLAQAVAIVIALFFNFTFHHVWTYRKSRRQRPA